MVKDPLTGVFGLSNRNIIRGWAKETSTIVLLRREYLNKINSPTFLLYFFSLSPSQRYRSVDMPHKNTIFTILKTIYHNTSEKEPLVLRMGMDMRVSIT